MPIKRAFLFTLFTVDWWAIFDFAIRAPLALIPYESSDYITIFASSWLAIRFNILLALFAYRTRTSFGRLLKFRATIRAFHHRKCSTTFLSEKLHKNNAD